MKRLLSIIISAHESYVSALCSTLSAHGYPTPNTATTSLDPAALCLSISKTEGKRAFQAWSSIISSVLSQVSSAAPLLTKLRDAEVALASSPAAAGGEKALKAAKEAGDVVWRAVYEVSFLVRDMRGRLK